MARLATTEYPGTSSTPEEWLLTARRPKDTRTHAQREALARYVIDFHGAHPGVRIVGHRDLPSVHKACPSFDVGTWLETIGIEQ